jgi:alkyl hydroperoxide reductase subunit F
MDFDALIIGAGPAGLAAAVYLARQKVRFAILTGDVGGKVLWSSDVENYLGFHLLDGVDLIKKFRAHLDDYKDAFTWKEGELVQSVAAVNGGFRIKTATAAYTSRTLLVATGQENRRLGVPGEKELMGKGVAYCATCDAPLFAGKAVHVVGGGNSAMDAALFLAKYAAQVTIVALGPELTGDARLKAACLAEPKIRVFPQTKTVRIEGGPFVTGIVLADASGAERTEPSQGVFVEVGLMPNTGFLDLVEKDRKGQVIVDAQNRTSVPGIFAAGDATSVPEKQIAIAVGEGSKAALQLIHYLQTL